MSAFLIERAGHNPLVFDGRDRNAAVPLKEGRKAAGMAYAISDSLSNIAMDYNVPESIMFAPYKMKFSYNPVSKYFGLGEDGVDNIRLARYSGEGTARHEGSHMGQMRVIESRLVARGGADAKKKSEREFEKVGKKHFFLIEKFADKYAGKYGRQTAGYFGLLGSEVATMSITLPAIMPTLTGASKFVPEDMALIGAIPVLGYAMVQNARALIGYFSDLKKIDM